MTVKEAIEILNDFPLDAVLVVPSFDHSYRKCDVRLEKAMKIGGDYYEDDPSAPADSKEQGKRVDVVVFG